MTTCPKCGSRFLRPARPQNLKEKLDKYRFIDPLRCLDCKTRFVARTFTWSDLKWARCPQCRRRDLNSWTGNNYVPELFWTGFKIQFGAHRYRCEYCRMNFSSFRKRKEVFTFSRFQKLGYFNNADQIADHKVGQVPGRIRTDRRHSDVGPPAGLPERRSGNKPEHNTESPSETPD